jgi:hypothetical protein
MMKTFFTLLIVASSLRGYAQDYLVTTKRDTLRGRLSISSFPTMDKVVVAVDRKKAEFPGTSVHVLVLDSQVFKPVRTPDAYRLMKLSRDGMVSLYYARQSPGTPYNIPFVVKRSGEAMEVTSLRFKKRMATFLAECSSIKTKIEQDKLGKKDLEKIIDEYNLCLDQQTRKTMVSSEDPRLVALNTMNSRFEKDATITSDARDILKDIYGKVRENKSIPNYLIEGLRESLKDKGEYQEDLEILIGKLKN